MALLDKMFGVDEKESKLKQEIKSLELRKESVFTAINNEIMRLENEKTALLLEAGETAYDGKKIQVKNVNWIHIGKKSWN